MKAYCHDWFRSTKKLPSWFKHAEYVEITWAQIQEVFDSGNDIMLRHSKTDEFDSFIIINVSGAHGFGQR